MFVIQPSNTKLNNKVYLVYNKDVGFNFGVTLSKTIFVKSYLIAYTTFLFIVTNHSLTVLIHNNEKIELTYKRHLSRVIQINFTARFSNNQNSSI